MLLDTPLCEFGWKAPDFTLKDPNGKEYNFHEQFGDKGVLVAFICNHCPYVQAIAEHLVEDAKYLQRNGINVVSIMSNDYRYFREDGPSNMKILSEHHGFTFPYLVDEEQTVGRAFGAVCTPDFFGFNKAGELQYRGRLDDSLMKRSDDRKRELVSAMMQVAETGKGPENQVASIGCSIKWSR